MSFYFRDSKKIGKNTKLNFSKSGVGVSTGIKNIRFGLNSKGQVYTHIGKGGFYYKKVLSIKKILNIFLHILKKF
jgi:hypothetical protein